MIRERRRKNGVINVSEDRGGGTSDEEIKGVTIGVSRERDKLSEIKGTKKREKRSRFRAGRVIKVTVEVTSDDELRRRRNHVLKEQRKISEKRLKRIRTSSRQISGFGFRRRAIDEEKDVGRRSEGDAIGCRLERREKRKRDRGDFKKRTENESKTTNLP